MKLINLSKNRQAIVDDEDFEYLNKFKWLFAEYAVTYKEGKIIRMHRLVNNTPDGFVTDHINRNKLDNRKENLRSVTTKQNNQNTSPARKINSRDRRIIRTLYVIGRYIPASISRLFGLSPQRGQQVIATEIRKNATIINEFNCQICGLDDAISYLIDGNPKNNYPQNIIMLCEADFRKFKHLQLRRRQGSLAPQLEA